MTLSICYYRQKLINVIKDRTSFSVFISCDIHNGGHRRVCRASRESPEHVPARDTRVRVPAYPHRDALRSLATAYAVPYARRVVLACSSVRAPTHRRCSRSNFLVARLNSFNAFSLTERARGGGDFSDVLRRHDCLKQ